MTDLLNVEVESSNSLLPNPDINRLKHESTHNRRNYLSAMLFIVVTAPDLILIRLGSFCLVRFVLTGSI